MNRKLTKKLTTSIQHRHDAEDEETGLGRGRTSYGQNARRGIAVTQQPITEEDEDEIVTTVTGRQQRAFDTAAINPFIYYDRQSRTDLGSTERIQSQDPITRQLNGSRIGASLLRTPSPIPAKSAPQADRWQVADEDDNADYDDFEDEDGDDDDGDNYGSSSRINRDANRETVGSLKSSSRKEKQQSGKKGSSSSVNNAQGQRGQQNEPKKGLSLTRKGSKGQEAKDQTQTNAGETKRSRGGGSGASISGNGNYMNTSSNSKVGRSGSAGSTRGSSNQLGRQELQALDIETPEGVTDIEAFRRYLSVRLGAVGPATHAPLPTFGDHVRGFGPPYGSSKTKHLSTAGLAGNAAASFLVQRKSMALSHAIMTLALLSASASQLRFVVAYSNAHSYPALNYFLICSCIFVEILVGIGYVIISRFEFTERTLDKTNTYLIFGLFFVAIANVIIASFALDDHVCEVLAVLAKQKEREQYDMIDNSSPVVAAHQSLA